MAPALGLSFVRRTRAPNCRLLGRRYGWPGPASAPAPATDLGWCSGAPCTKTPAKGCAQEGQAAAIVTALGSSFVRRTKAPNSRLLGRRYGGTRAASAPAPATDLGWRSGAPCTITPAEGCAQEGQAAAIARAPGTRFGSNTRAPSSRLLKRRYGGPGAASASAPATDLGWRSGAPCSRTPANGCAQEGQAAAMAPALGSSFGRRTRAPSSRLLKRR